MSIDQAERWRDTFLSCVEPNKDLPLLLSGGLDSATILAAQLELGGRPDCYTFTVGGAQTRDLLVSRAMCEEHDLRHVIVSIERNEDFLISDIWYIMRNLGVKRKAHIQCAQPVIHMARNIKIDGYDGALCGTGGIVEDNKKVVLILHHEGEEAARAYRSKSLVKRGAEGTATRTMHRAAESQGVELAEPYTDKPMRELTLLLNMSELNHPKQKGIALRAFPDFWARPWYRKNAPMQVEAGVRAWHDTLLQTDWNRRGNVSVVGIYNDMYNELEHREPA